MNLTIGVHSMAPAGGTELNVFQVSRRLAQRGPCHRSGVPSRRIARRRVPDLLPKREPSSCVRLRRGRPPRATSYGWRRPCSPRRGRRPTSSTRIASRRSCGRRPPAVSRERRSCAISTRSAMPGPVRFPTPTYGASSPSRIFFGGSGWKSGSIRTSSMWCTTGCRATTTRPAERRSGPRHVLVSASPKRASSPCTTDASIRRRASTSCWKPGGKLDIGSGEGTLLVVGSPSAHLENGAQIQECAAGGRTARVRLEAGAVRCGDAAACRRRRGRAVTVGRAVSRA